MIQEIRGRFMKRFVPSFVALFFLIGGTLAFAGGQHEKAGAAPAAASPSPVKIAAIIKGLDNPYFQAMEQGLEAQAKADNVSLTVQAATSITDTAGQADKLNALAGQDYSCYIVNPISGTNLIQGIAQITAENKPIINIDNPVDATAAQAANAKIATYIGTDNVQAGRIAGKHMSELLPNGGDVAVIGGIAGDVTSAARIKGFEEGIASNVNVVQTVAANWNRQQAFTQADTVLRARPSLAGFFVANDDMGLGVARAVADHGLTGKVKIISVDGIKDALLAVKAGQVSAVVAQYPYAMGSMAVQACEASAAGKTLPSNVTSPVELITQDNADQALAVTPKPFTSYSNPFTALLNQ